MFMKVSCIYNKYFFEQHYKFMIANQYNVATDASGTVWHLLDVEEILVKEYGYRRTQSGII